MAKAVLYKAKKKKRPAIMGDRGREK